MIIIIIIIFRRSEGEKGGEWRMLHELSGEYSAK